ncbi:MAG: hypothetical protein KJZ96_07405 [Rhodocyclaceae bacterium]|uniref:hypothetical protein n=1 Tax=Thauera sp. AutoDN2 TaxID=3416051 RepID=UPI003F4B0180|nr:hypothetical protein [Rhodocyclaceae bacterium]
MKRRHRTLPPSAPVGLEAEERARIEAARTYLKRTHEAFAQALRSATSLEASGRGVLAGPLVKRRSRAGREGGGTA